MGISEPVPGPAPVPAPSNNRPEPATISAAIQALLVLGMAFAIPGLTTETIGLIMAVVAALLGFYVAWQTNATVLGLVVGLAQALLNLVVGFGAEIDPGQQAAIIAVVASVIGMWQRTQVTPLVKGEFNI